MAKEKVKCSKCGELHYCEEHHILPEKLFGENDTIRLCSNCHKEYHYYLGHKYLRKENKQSIEFYFEKWLKWYYMLALAGILLLVYNFGIK